MEELTEGQPAPDFNAQDTEGKKFALSKLRGKNVVLYFYPKDDTPGCTIQACAFRDDFEKYVEKKAVVLGVSLDDQASHQKFVEKYKLPFPLLVDTDAAISKAYGAYGEKSFLGKKFEGIKRKTFLIDKKGNLAKIWPNVNPVGHSRDVLGELEKLG